MITNIACAPHTIPDASLAGSWAHTGCVAGVLGAVSVLLRTVQFEISDASSTDKGTSMPGGSAQHGSMTVSTLLSFIVLEYLTPCWAIGAAIGERPSVFMLFFRYWIAHGYRTGPMIGGLLAEPARTMPHLFTWQVWTTFPYLLPSLVTSLMPLASAVACLLYIPEVRISLFQP